jgi:serine/threonine protein kinase
MQVESVADANRVATAAEKACSPLYRPPEMYEPPTRGNLDGRVDIWALGAVLYFMMMRVNPFEKQCMQGASLVLAVQRAKVGWEGAPDSLHPDLKELVHACLRPKLEERPTCSELRQWIGRVKAWIGR